MAAEKTPEHLSKEETLELARKGELPVRYDEDRTLSDTWTPENFERFIRGELTLAQLEGLTMEEAYAIADYAYTLYEEGRLKDARLLFEGLVVQNPYDAYLHTMLGAIYYRMDMPEEAVDAYSLAIKLDHENLHAHVNRGEILLQHGEFIDAYKDFQIAIQLDPDGQDPATLRAKALGKGTKNIIDKLSITE